MDKKILAVSLALPLLTLAACSPASSVTGSGAMVDDDDQAMASSAAMIDDDDAVMDDDDAMAAASSAAPATDEGTAAGVRVVDVTVTDWSFTPATVTAKKGEKVQLRLTDDEGIHSLLVADLGLNVRVEPGQVTAVDLPTDKAGTFEGRCGVPCGPGHRDMKFTIVVE